MVADSDVIMTAAIVGFSAKLVAEGKPVQFDTEGIYAEMPAAELAVARESIQQMQTTVAKINRVLARVELPARVEAGTSPAYDYHEKLVYGVERGESVPFIDRNVTAALVGEARELHDLALRDPTLSYQGRGAYTGLVVPPEGGGKPAITYTYCSIVPDDAADGERWHPAYAEGLGSGPHQRTWGMIGNNQLTEDLRAEGMGFVPPLPWTDLDPEADILGYTHGMITAVVKCYVRGRDGSRPFEIVVGNRTTKLASCFPCTMFMYATEFPPSSIHLDKAESWVPMYSSHFAAPPDAVEHTNARFRAFSTECIHTGLRVLQRSRDLVHESHHASLDALHAFVHAHTDPTTCANLILDALTISEKERVRVSRTLLDG